MLEMEHTVTVLEFLDIFQKKLENSLEMKICYNIYRIQAYKSIMCGYVCIRFIDFMLNGKKNFQIYFLLMSTKNGKIILKYFQ